MQTSKNLSPFKFKGHEVRTDKTEEGIIFVAKDVCLALGLTRTNDALGKLDLDQKLMRKVSASGQKRKMWFVTESGLYQLIFRSNKPEAKVFRKWVTSEVLPTLRKTGQYGVISAREDVGVLAALTKQIEENSIQILYHRREQVRLKAKNKKLIAARRTIRVELPVLHEPVLPAALQPKENPTENDLINDLLLRVEGHITATYVDDKMTDEGGMVVEAVSKALERLRVDDTDYGACCSELIEAIRLYDETFIASANDWPDVLQLIASCFIIFGFDATQLGGELVTAFQNHGLFCTDGIHELFIQYVKFIDVLGTHNTHKVDVHGDDPYGQFNVRGVYDTVGDPDFTYEYGGRYESTDVFVWSGEHKVRVAKADYRAY